MGQHRTRIVNTPKGRTIIHLNTSESINSSTSSVNSNLEKKMTNTVSKVCENIKNFAKLS